MCPTAMSTATPSLPPARYVRGESDIFEYLHSVLKERIMILDGAMGTMIQTHKLGEAEYARLLQNLFAVHRLLLL